MAKDSYFDLAKQWSIDRYYLSETRLSECKTALFFSCVLNGLLGIAVTFLASNQTIVPLMVHHYANGVVTVDKPKESELVIDSEAQVKSDIYRYIVSRESYDISSYSHQFDEVTALSSSNVTDEFDREQHKSNLKSPINTLGANFSRSVHIYSINFIDRFIEKNKVKNTHHNLAEVIFSTMDRDKQTGKVTEKSYTALISWSFAEPSDNPKVRWLNWDGFQVSRYSKEERINS